MQAPARIRIFCRTAEISLFPSKETKYYKKVKIKLGDIERRILVKLFYKKRNELIREGRDTNAIDDPLWGF